MSSLVWALASMFVHMSANTIYIYIYIYFFCINVYKCTVFMFIYIYLLFGKKVLMFERCPHQVVYTPPPPHKKKKKTQKLCTEKCHSPPEKAKSMLWLSNLRRSSWSYHDATLFRTDGDPCLKGRCVYKGAKVKQCHSNALEASFGELVYFPSCALQANHHQPGNH